MTISRTKRREPGAELLARGWVPKDGWRWVTDLEVTPLGKAPHAERMAGLFTHALELLKQPESERDGWSRFAHRHGREWLERAIAEAPEQAGPGSWLVPAGPLAQGVPIRRGDGLKAFLLLGVEPSGDPRPEITAFASRFGWLGRPQLLIPTDGSTSIHGEPLMAWLEEISLLRRLRALLDACDRLERSDVRADLRKSPDARIEQFCELARTAGLTVNLTSARLDDLIRDARLGVRAILEPRLLGQFSSVLVEDDGPVERFVPSTLAATLELELARLAVKGGQRWDNCKACKTLFPVGRADNVFCSDRCRKRASRPPSPRQAS